MTAENKFTTEEEQEKSAVKATVQKYLTAIEADDREVALSLLSEADRTPFSEDWENSVDDFFLKELTGYRIDNIDLSGQLVIDGNSRDYAHALVSFGFKSEVPMDFTYNLVKEGDWKMYFRSDVINKTYSITRRPGFEIWDSASYSQS